MRIRPWRRDLTALAETLGLLGRHGDAATAGRDAVALADSVWGSEHPAAAEARIALGTTLVNLDEGEAALTLYQDAARASPHTRVPGPDDPGPAQ